MANEPCIQVYSVQCTIQQRECQCFPMVVRLTKSTFNFVPLLVASCRHKLLLYQNLFILFPINNSISLYYLIQCSIPWFFSSVFFLFLFFSSSQTSSFFHRVISVNRLETLSRNVFSVHVWRRNIEFRSNKENWDKQEQSKATKGQTKDWNLIKTMASNGYNKLSASYFQNVFYTFALHSEYL